MFCRWVRIVRLMIGNDHPYKKGGGAIWQTSRAPRGFPWNISLEKVTNTPSHTHRRSKILRRG